jgi:antibiotic biosynthesis monooxygenase (ABM) superfamily enzyme
MNIKFNLDKKNSNTIAIRNSYNQSYLILNWKRAIITWIGIYTIITILVHTIGTWTTSRPLSISTLIITSISVPLMTFIVTPQLEKFLKNWLISKA